MSKNILVSAGVALLVVVLGFAFFGPSENVIVQKVVEIVKKFGATPGSNFQSNVIKIAGSPLVGVSTGFTVGTTSVCALDVRGYASSSIVALGGVVNGVPTTTTGSTWRWYKSTNGFATTTLIAGRGAITATGTAIFATTTLAADAGVLGAGDNFLVLDFQGGSSPYLAIEGQTGKCSVLLHSPNAQ